METALLLGLAGANAVCAAMGLTVLARPDEGDRLIKVGVMIVMFSLNTGALVGIAV